MDYAATVHLVDDDPSFLAAVGRMLRASGFKVAAHASAAELLGSVSPESRGCVVADLSMPGVDGLELQALLAGRGIAMPMVFLTGHGDIPSSVRAMRSGAVDFLEKGAPRDNLLTAVTGALDQDAAAHVARQKVAERRRRLAALTEREREVLTLVARGNMNKQIAAALGIHERTVKLHRTAITTKLGVHTVAQLALLVNEAQLPDAVAKAAPGP